MLVYAHCIVGQDEAARRRIDAAMAAEDLTAAPEGRSGPRIGHRQPDTTGPNRIPPDSIPDPAESPPTPDLEL
jgi:hypothetical protein